MIKKVKHWMEWRGITAKDLITTACALGFLLFACGFITYNIVVTIIS